MAQVPNAHSLADVHSDDIGSESGYVHVSNPPSLGEGTEVDQGAAVDHKASTRRAAVLKVIDTITEQTIAKCVELLERLTLPVEPTLSESVPCYTNSPTPFNL